MSSNEGLGCFFFVSYIASYFQIEKNDTETLCDG